MAKIPIDMKSGDVAVDETVIVGIDLGTTNSLVAFIKGGEPMVIKKSGADTALVPSIIHFGNSGGVTVGKDAIPFLLTDPQNTVFSVKRLMGKSFQDINDYQNFFSYKIIEENEDQLVKIQVGEKFYNPIELSALILKQLKETTEAFLNKNVTQAVITVPAYFNDAQRQATRDAGKIAGLDVLRIINEPTAASLAYGLNEGKNKEELIAVYDLGGGTFDISILQIDNGVFEVLSTNGDTFLGGDDFDKAIIDHWIKEHDIDTGKLDDSSFYQNLRLSAEEAKKHLSTQNSFKKEVNGLLFSLDKSAFEALIKPLVDRTLTSCQEALKDAKLSKENIDHIIMVGGSTRSPFVYNQVSAFFGKPANNSLNPDEVVALGAAVQANILSGHEKDLLLLDITPLSLGIETIGGLMDVLVPRNTTIPTKVGRQYTTSVDGQANLKVSVFQGERDLVEDNRKLGEFVMKGIPPMPAGIPKIEIQFLIDADGILKVTAKELRSGVQQSIHIKSQYGIDEEEMGKMLMDSMHNAKEDMIRKGVIEAKVEAQNVILSSEKFIIQNATILSDKESKQLNSYIEGLKQAVRKEDKDLINLKMQDLNDFSAPLAHRAMDHNIAVALKGKKV